MSSRKYGVTTARKTDHKKRWSVPPAFLGEAATVNFLEKYGVGSLLSVSQWDRPSFFVVCLFSAQTLYVLYSKTPSALDPGGRHDLRNLATGRLHSKSGGGSGTARKTDHRKRWSVPLPFRSCLVAGSPNCRHGDGRSL